MPCRRNVRRLLPSATYRTTPRALWSGAEVRIQVRTSTVEGAGVVSVLGEIDLSTASRLREAVGDHVEAGLCRLVIDLRGVTFMDSTGLGLLVGTQKVATACGGSVRVVCDSPRLLRLLRVTGLSGSLAVLPSLEEALEEWPSAASETSATNGRSVTAQVTPRR